MPTTLDDIAGWVQNDMLHRTSDTDIQAVCRKAALQFYRILCNKVPFDELSFTSPEFPLVASQGVYRLGSDFIFTPQIRSIQNIRITFSTGNRQRLRRSHVRVFDALSFSQPSRPATYARQGNTIQLEPPPNSAAYTLRFRYFGLPPIGAGYVVTNAVWTAGSLVFTVGTHSVVAGHVITVCNGNPSGLDGTYTVTSVVANVSITAALSQSPGVFVASGAVLTDTTDTNYWNTIILTPTEWDELLQYETLYKVYYALDQPEKAMALMQPMMVPRQPGSPQKTRVAETGIIPRLWNDLLSTTSQNENVDEDFGINPTIRAYSNR